VPSVTVAGIDPAVAEQMKVLYTARCCTASATDFREARHSCGEVVHLPRPRDNLASADARFGADVGIKSDSLYNRLLKRSNARHSSRDDPQAAATAEQRRSDRALSAQTIRHQATALQTALVAGHVEDHLQDGSAADVHDRNTATPAYLNRHIYNIHSEP